MRMNNSAEKTHYSKTDELGVPQDAVKELTSIMYRGRRTMFCRGPMAVYAGQVPDAERECGRCGRASQGSRRPGVDGQQVI